MPKSVLRDRAASKGAAATPPVDGRGRRQAGADRTSAARKAARAAAAGAARTGRRRKLAILGALVLCVAIGATWAGFRRRPAPPPIVVERPDATETRLRQAIAANPTDPVPCRELGEYFLRRGRSFSAMWEFQEALARQPEDVDSRIGMARAAATAGQSDYAIAQLLPLVAPEATVLPTDRREAARMLVVLYLRTARPEEALALLRSFKPPLQDMELEWARAYRAAGEFAAAEKAYRRALADPGVERRAQIGLAQLYLEWDRPKDAVRLLEAAGRQGAMDAERWLWLGRAYAASPRGLDRAAACVLNAIKLDPRYAEAYYEAGRLFTRRGDPTAAADQFTQATRLDPRHAEARRALADALRALGLTKRAREQMATYYELRGQPDRVIATLTADGASPVADVQTAVRTVYAWTQLQEPQRAAKLLELALKQHPNDRTLWTQALSVQVMAGSPQKLNALAREWEQKSPGIGEVPWFRGRLALAEARVADAIREFEAAVDREPRRAGFRLALADAYARVPTPQNLRKALPLAEQAAAADPNNPDARRQLGDLLLRLGRPQAAETHLVRTLDLNPEQPAVMTSLIQICNALKRPGHAALLGQLAREIEARDRELARLKRAVRARPDDAQARLALGRALARDGQLQAALAEFERAAEDPSRPEARQALARIQRTLQVLRG